MFLFHINTLNVSKFSQKQTFVTINSIKFNYKLHLLHRQIKLDFSKSDTEFCIFLEIIKAGQITRPGLQKFYCLFTVKNWEKLRKLDFYQNLLQPNRIYLVLFEFSIRCRALSAYTNLAPGILQMLDDKSIVSSNELNAIYPNRM